MGRDDTFYDSTFNRNGYDPSDIGDFELNKVFVIMPFNREGMDDVYLTIKDECQKLGLHACRADEFVGSGMIIDEITRLIERSEFIVCDLTFERPNVYYELGYAHGVGNRAQDILLIAQEGTTLHFDIAPLRVQYYASTQQLRKIASSSLTEMIRITRKKY
jgi:hypothetical protein